MSIGVLGPAGGYTHLQQLQVESVHLKWFSGKGYSCFFPSATEGIKKAWIHGTHCVIHALYSLLDVGVAVFDLKFSGLSSA